MLLVLLVTILHDYHHHQETLQVHCSTDEDYFIVSRKLYLFPISMALFHFLGVCDIAEMKLPADFT